MTLCLRFKLENWRIVHKHLNIVSMINEEASQQESDLILIRHAQSTYNEATIVTAGEMGLTGVWDDYIKSDLFNQRVTYN